MTVWQSIRAKLTWKRIIIAVIVVPLGIVLFWIVRIVVVLIPVLINPGEPIQSACDFNSPDNHIESIARFELPPSAILLDSNCFGMQGWWASAKFEMASQDLETFLESTRIEEPMSDSGQPQHLSVDGMDSYLVGGFYDVELTQEIVIDTSDPERYIVYVWVTGG